MTSMAVAAMMVQLMAAGGAGSQGEQATERRDASAADVGKHLSALKGELTSLSEQFRVARERRRLEAEKKKRENEEWHLGPQAPAAPASERTPATARGAGASAR
jgi:hypothetical protein